MMLIEQARRQSLKHLLATCRTRLDPKLLLPGFRLAGRGAVHGVTQHEAAQLLGISPRQYGKLERGELTSPTTALLATAAEQLSMTPEERVLFYLFASGHLPPQPGAPCTTLPRTMTKSFLRLVEPHPALITDHAWNVVQYNKPLAAWFTDPHRLAPADRNIMLWLFTDAAAARLVDIGDERRGAIARLHTACGRAPADPALETLVTQLLNIPAAAELWAVQSARISPVIYVRRMRHPADGTICSVPCISTALPGGQYLALHLVPGTATTLPDGDRSP